VPEFHLAGRAVGDGHPVYVVAELSANHGGSLERAKRTILAARDAGADAIKVQTYTPDTLTLRSRAAPFVVKTRNAWDGRTLWDLYAEAMTPWEWHADLQQTATEAGLAFFSTPFDPTAAAFLRDLDPPAYKIASFELVDLPLIEHVARLGRPMILSTGMATHDEVIAAVRTCRDAGNDAIALLRCVSAYPASAADMHLGSLSVLRELGVVLGLSDHTRDSTAAIAATALGARIVEKHFTLDRSLGGPDSFFSLEPDEFRALVGAIRATEQAVRGPRFGPAPDERAGLAFRRSLFVTRDVQAGEVLTCDDVRSVRPSDGIAASALPGVLGRVATRALHAATPLAWDMVGATPGTPSPELQPATLEDADALRALRNLPDVVAATLTGRPVTEDEHAAWCARVLTPTGAERTTRMWVTRGADGTLAGQLRLDRRGANAAEVSIAVAPAHRRSGVATGLLRAVEGPARGWGVHTLLATIRRDNAASVRLFKRAGYYAFVEGTHDGVPVWTCERRIVPYGEPTSP
jgi:N-acetylneuraminate synthase